MTPGDVLWRKRLIGTGDIQTISIVKQIFFPDKSKPGLKNFTTCLTKRESGYLIFALQLSV